MPDGSSNKAHRKSVRCAVYTRKSHEEGLEQDFNSLDAQREACEAYIISQKHEGWVVLSDLYDDGGVSGATMNRPALQRLLNDIKQGKVDTVVVYKIDRLTRTLADFARMVDVFDQHDASFVSVTQQFNTTSSMGRLTLNVLLSFAQFEREVTGERIRDKIAASKKKGLWMGGLPPLGYDARDKKLFVNEKEAVAVCHIFRRYTELRSLRLLKDVLERDGIVSKVRVDRHGRRVGGKPLARGALHHLLQNRIYIGEIVHKDKSYPGEHASIIDQALWDHAQSIIAGNRVDHASGRRARNPSLLAGLLYDAQGHRMAPSHANKKGKRYRYYISHTLMVERRRNDPEGRRIPAGKLESLVSDRIQAYLGDDQRIWDALRDQVTDPALLQHQLNKVQGIVKAWPSLEPARQRQILHKLIDRITVRLDQVNIELYPAAIAGMDLADQRFTPSNTEPTLTLNVPVRFKRGGMEIRMLIDGAQREQTKAPPNQSLIRLIAMARHHHNQVLNARGRSLQDLAKEAGVTRSYFTRILRLAYLAPGIVQDILNGEQPPHLTAYKLTNASKPSLDWTEQRRRLGFN